MQQVEGDHQRQQQAEDVGDGHGHHAELAGEDAVGEAGVAGDALDDAAQERLDVAVHDGALGEADDPAGDEHADDLVHEEEGEREHRDADERPDQGAAEAGARSRARRSG